MKGQATLSRQGYLAKYLLLMLSTSAEERKAWDPGDIERIMWKKTPTNSLSHNGPDSPPSHFSSVPRQMNHFQQGLHQCKYSAMFWINPSPRLLLTGLIYHPTRCTCSITYSFSCLTCTVISYCLGSGSSCCTLQSLETSHPHLSHFYCLPHTPYSSRYKVQSECTNSNI